jgi:DNA-binding winged helix-turn-helix (wHTH) protein
MGPTAQRRIARFGVFEADFESRQLTKNGFRIRLQEKPFQLLMLLLERQGLVVTREELKEKLWPSDTFVEFDVGLNTAVKKLRAALSDSAENPRFVETVPRLGYRFVAPVSVARPESASVVDPEGTVPTAEACRRGRLSFRDRDRSDLCTGAGRLGARTVRASSVSRGAAPGSVCGGEGVCLTRAGDGQRLGGRAGCPWHGPFSQRVGLEGGGAQPATCARNQSGSHRGAPAVWVATGSARAARRWVALQATGARERSAIARRFGADRHPKYLRQ